MKTPKFPTNDAAANREIMRKIYMREMTEAIPARNKALLFIMLCISAAAIACIVKLLS